MFSFQIFLIRANIYMRIIFTDKNSILYTEEKSEILESTKCYGFHSFSRLAVKLWNLLSNDIHFFSTFHKVKNKIKRCVFLMSIGKLCI